MTEAQLFTVRVWRQAEQFRAVVRAAGDEQAHLFTAPTPLAAFLVDAAADSPAPKAPAWRAGDAPPTEP